MPGRPSRVRQLVESTAEEEEIAFKEVIKDARGLLEDLTRAFSSGDRPTLESLRTAGFMAKCLTDDLERHRQKRAIRRAVGQVAEAASAV